MTSMTAAQGRPAQSRKRRRPIGPRLKLFLSTIALALAAGIWTVCGLAGLDEWRLVHRGVVTEGFVADRHFEIRSGGRRSSILFYVAFGFRTEDGRAFADRCLVEEFVFNAVERGAPVLVRYVPDEPTNACLQAELAGRSGYNTLVSGGLIGLVAAGVGFGGAISAVRQRASLPPA